MGPKKEKAITIADENQWKRDIETAVLNDETFSMKVVMIDRMGNEHDKVYLSKFEDVAKKQGRYVIQNINKTETIFMVNQLGADKKEKDDNMRVFEEAYRYTKAKEDVPAEILALIVKKLVMKIKEDYVLVRQQKLEVKEGLRQESSVMIDKAVVRGTVFANREASPEPDAMLADPPPIVPAEDKKYNTVLREKGEEWRDRVYVNDYPTDGPHAYLAITGFANPLLPWALISIGVPISAVIQIRINLSTTEVPLTYIEAAKRRLSSSHVPEPTVSYWEELEKIRILPETANLLKDTAFIVFCPPYRQDEALSDSPDIIYDEISYLMYDIQDLTRQHQHYLDNIHIQHIPEYAEDVLYMNDYQNQIDTLPLECVTIYSIIDALLETTSRKLSYESFQGDTSMTTAATMTYSHPVHQHDVPNSDSQDKVKQAEDIVKNLFKRLCQTEETQKSYRITYGEEYETHKDPITIKYGDYAKYSTFHVENINLHDTVISALSGMPINQLWRHQERPELELEAKVNFHVNALLSCFEREDVETAELNRLLHILACKKLYNNRSSLKKKHLGVTTIEELKKAFLKRSVLAEPLNKRASIVAKDTLSCPSFTRIESESASSTGEGTPESNSVQFLFDCTDISELVSAAELASKQPTSNVIDDFEFFEDFAEAAALQIMLVAFNMFNCVDYKYCEVTDCIVLMFFNSHDKDGIAREQWRNHLPTPVCLQDFFDFILDEHYEWVKNEEKLYEELRVIKRLSKVQVSSHVAACIEDTDVESDMLMEGSLKYQARIAEATSCDTSYPTEDSLPTTPSQKSELSPIFQKSDKKNMSASSKKHKKQSNTVYLDESEIMLPMKPFFGYELGDRRFEIIGKDSTFFSRDGTKVRTQYTLTVPNNDEYVSLNVVPGNGTNEFWIHKALGERCSPIAAEATESFRVVTKDQVMINIRKHMYEVPIILSKMPDSELNRRTSAGSPLSSKDEPAREMPFHSLYVTWPNGQITESVHVENSSDISHIKQTFLTNTPFNDEDMRCISTYGEVIIFKTSGIIEVLRPGGIRILITKCSKRVDKTDSKSQIELLNKESKMKKGKDKPSKSKSKIIAPVEELEKLREYVLDIREFEIIDTSGLKQRWYEDTHENIEKLYIRTATDYCTGEILLRRMDGTHSFINKDGIQIVTFPDKTRIITEYVIEDEEIYPEWTDYEKEYFDLISETDFSTSSEYSQSDPSQKSVESEQATEYSSKRKPKRRDGYVSVQIIYTVENCCFATVTVNKQKSTVSITSPNRSCVTVDSNNHYNIALDSANSAYFDGSNLKISYEACPECKSSTCCDVNMEKFREPEPKSESDVKMKMESGYWLKVEDSFCKTVVVDNEGNITVAGEPCLQKNTPTEQAGNAVGEDSVNKQETEESPEDPKSDAKSETSTYAASECQGKCRQVNDEKGIRFFVLHRDLSCSELIRRKLIEKYQHTCRLMPWCSINQYDTFGDHRTLWSLLTPIPLTESEKWRMDSKFNNKPKNLNYCNLKPDTGKGFYPWMRPYERYAPKTMKQETELPPKLPKAFILRTLEQQWKDSEREEFKGGRELVHAILKYRQMMAQDCETLLHSPIIDTRTDSEKITDQKVQQIGQKICRDLAKRLNEDLKNRSVATITTKPFVPLKVCAGDEFAEVPSSPFEEDTNLVEELEKVVPISPNLERYWRKRAEELKEEKYHQYVLRQTTVPPYFLGSLLGSVWWMMNRLVDNAVSTSERKKTTCICADKEDRSYPDEELLIM